MALKVKQVVRLLDSLTDPRFKGASTNRERGCRDRIQHQTKFDAVEFAVNPGANFRGTEAPDNLSKRDLCLSETQNENELVCLTAY